MRTTEKIADALLIIGGLNWGLVGIAKFDLVARIFGMSFGQTSVLSSAVYVLVGLSAIAKALAWASNRRHISEESPADRRAA